MKLKLADDLKLPLETVTQKLAWLGTTGSGKTYGASKLAELFFDASAQFVVLDPVGVWYGLRLAKDGKTPSDVTIPIFGGLHGDVPLEPTGGALLANLVVDRAISVILDVSQFESDADKARFGHDFADRFFFRKKAAPSAVHLFIEECQEFVPQNPMKGEERMLHAFTRLQKLGRNFGIGSSYISQRPQEVNKKALNMAQTLFVFRTTGTHERAAIEKWIEDKALDQDIAGDLPKIETGDCHVWSPEFLKISEVVHILEKRTFNASATPEVGVAAKARHLAPIDLEKVRGDMAATIEKAKAEDPRELRKQIADLKKQLALKPSAAAEKVSGKIREVPVLTDHDREQLKTLAEQLALRAGDLEHHTAAMVAKATEAFGEVMNRLQALGQAHQREFLERLDKAGFQKILGKLSDIAGRREEPTSRAPTGPTPAHRAELGSRVRHPLPRRLAQAADGDGTVRAGERKILTAIAQHPEGVTREQLTVLTGYRRSSRDTYLQRLTQNGFAVASGDRVVVTQAGVDVLGADFEPLPTGDELRRYWLDRLTGGERALLEVLVKAYPQPVDRERLSEATNYQRSSRDTYLQRLGARKLIVTEGRGLVRASEELFS